MVQVGLEHLGLDLCQGGPGGVDLGQDVDAVTPLLDHARDPAHLALDAVQAGKEIWFVVAMHGRNVIPLGGSCQGTPLGYNAFAQAAFSRPVRTMDP